MKSRAVKLLKFKNQTGELIVKRRYSPWVKLFFAGLIAVIIIVTGGLIYNHGLNMAGFDRLSVYERQQSVRDELKQVKAENQELRESLARVQRAMQMNESAYQELDQSLKDSERETVKLREELSFYRNIISPSNKISGLQIQSLNIERLPGEDSYRFKLVLIQALKHDQSVQGRAKLEITGVQAGKDEVITYPGVGDKPLIVNFKYFQDLEGNIKLPKHFKPLRVKITVDTAGRDNENVNKVYAWPQV